jgi:hypothetical protein
MLTCCSTGVKTAVKNDVQWDSLWVDKSYHLMNVDTNPGCFLQIRFVYPVDFPDKNVLKSAQQQFIIDYFGDKYADMTPEMAVEKYSEDYINTFKQDEKDFLKEEKDEHPFEIEEVWNNSNEISSNQILYNQNNLLSVEICKEFYTGGAHGAHNYTNRVFDLKTGLRITESELFIEDYQDDLAKIMVDGIAVANNVDNALELENMGFFNINEIYPNKNFYVDDVGITYTFNEYDIAAYALGPVTVQLPYEKIRHLLRPNSPIAAIAF